MYLYFVSCRALQPPGWLKDWHCGVRVSKSGRLVGFISAVPATLSIYNQLVKWLYYYSKYLSTITILLNEIAKRKTSGTYYEFTFPLI